MGHQRGLTVPKLVELIGASRASIYRDLDVFTAANLPVDRETVAGEVRVKLRSSPIPAYAPTPKQLWALMFAQQFLEPLEGTNLHTALEALVKRWSASAAAKPPSGVSVSSQGGPSLPRWNSELERAIESRAELKIQYRGHNDKTSRCRFIEPAELRLHDGQVYVIAYEVSLEAYRVFKVSRIESIERTGKKLAPRPEYDGQCFFENAVGIWSAEAIEVEVRLEATFARVATEWPLSEAQEVVPWGSDGDVLVRATVAGEVEAMRWVLRWGGSAEVRKPESLRARVQDELRKALRGYGGEG